MRPDAAGFTVTPRARFSFSLRSLRWDTELGSYRLGRPVGNGLVTSRSLARSCSARFRNRARLLCIACPENGLMDVITRIHGHTMFAECVPMRPDSLLLHGPVFRSRCARFAGTWNWAATV